MNTGSLRRSGERPPHAGFRPDIQGLRAVAVGAVVLAHAHIPGLEGGFVGVDVFFVISGFLITGLLLADAGRKGRVDFGAFYARRALRILPAATLVIVCTALASVHVLDFVRARSALTDGVWATFFAANVHFSQVGTDYFAGGAGGAAVSPFQHFWSLSVEEQFYLVWPALLAVTLFGRRPGRHRSGRATPLRGRVVLILAVIVGISLYISIHQTATAPTAAYFSTFARTWELGAGALLAVAMPGVRRLPPSLRAGLTWVGGAAVVVAVLIFDDRTPFPGTAALLPVLGACAVIAGGVDAPRRSVAVLLDRRAMRFLGDISYSLYLWHWPLLILAADRAGHPLSTTQSLVVISVAVVLAAVTYRLVEDPFRHASRSWARRPGRALAIWPVAVVTVVTVSLLVVPSDPIGVRAPLAAAAGPDAVAQVQRAVAEARAGAPLPSAVSPALDKVNSDFKGIGACSGYHKTTNEVCQLAAASGSKRMAVFGDSHTTMWLPALVRDAEDAHVQLYPEVKENCTLQSYVVAPTSSSPCAVWYAFALKTLATLHPSLIVVSVFRVGPFHAALATIIADMRARAGRVLVLEDTPYLPVGPAVCILRPGATQRSCLWPYVTSVDDHASQVIALRAGAAFVNVDPWFCAAGECPSVIDGLIPFTDDRHVTGTYARFLAPALAPYLKLD